MSKLSLELRSLAIVFLVLLTLYVIFHQQAVGNDLSLQIRHIHNVLARPNNNRNNGGGDDDRFVGNLDTNKSKQTNNKNTTATPSDYDMEEELQWLDRSDSKPFRNYGDGTCMINTDRMAFIWLLRKWTDIVKKHKIRYFLDFGSLLGAWRDENVIPYDADIDIRVHNDDLMTLFNHPSRVRKFSWSPYDDYNVHIYFTRDWKLPYRMRRIFSCKGKLVEEYEGKCSFTDPIARLIYRQWHLDIFTYTDYHETVKFLPKGEQSFLKDHILPLARCDFMGMECRCPKKPIIVLQEYYRNLFPSKICKNKTWVTSY